MKPRRWKKVLSSQLWPTALLGAIIIFYVRRFMPDERAAREPVTLFIAIGTKPSNFKLRAGLRRTWLSQAASDSNTRYKFFTEEPRSNLQKQQLRHEILHSSDIEMQNIDGGYRAFAQRALLQLRYALTQHPQLTHYLRVDDDTYLCYRKFRWELALRPTTNFFWGKYFCIAGKHCADENFMLMSADVARRVLTGVDSGALHVRRNNTFARNFGMWSSRWPDLTVFDDRERFDVQQGLLTKYMHVKMPVEHNTQYAQFCAQYLFAHWVKSPLVMDLVFSAPVANLSLPHITSNVQGCPDPTVRTIHLL